MQKNNTDIKFDFNQRASNSITKSKKINKMYFSVPSTKCRRTFLFKSPLLGAAEMTFFFIKKDDMMEHKTNSFMR